MPKRITAGDFYTLTRCDRMVYLDHHGDPAQRAPQSEYQKWLRQQGQQFEQQVAETFDTARPPYTYENLEVGAQITLGFMREGVPRVYQGVLLDGNWAGIPDLLERVDGNSVFGEFFYRPVDIKSASSSTKGHRLQVMLYCRLLEKIQGVRPDGALLLRFPLEERRADNLYHEEAVEFDEDAFAAARHEVEALAGGNEPRPFISSVCAECAWRVVCRPIAEAAQDISLIGGLRRDVWRGLHDRGLGSLSALAQVKPGNIIGVRGVGEKTAPALIARAQALASGQMIRVGRPMLPTGPSIIFDVESLPSHGLFYLMGTLVGDDRRFEYDLAERPEDEHKMWAAFMRRIEGLPGAIFHYGNYERQAVNRLAARHGSQEQADRLLDRMVDLEKVLGDSVVLPLPGDSLKAVAPWLGFRWASEITGGVDSVLEYVYWLDDGQRDHLGRILSYNEQDCRATQVVLDWLRNV